MNNNDYHTRTTYSGPVHVHYPSAERSYCSPEQRPVMGLGSLTMLETMGCTCNPATLGIICIIFSFWLRMLIWGPSQGIHHIVVEIPPFPPLRPWATFPMHASTAKLLCPLTITARAPSPPIVSYAEIGRAPDPQSPTYRSLHAQHVCLRPPGYLAAFYGGQNGNTSVSTRSSRTTLEPFAYPIPWLLAATSWTMKTHSPLSFVCYLNLHQENAY